MNDEHDDHDAKRSKSELSWKRVQDIFIKIAHTFDDCIHRVYNFLEAPLEILIASGAYLTFKEAIQARILSGVKPGYEIGIDGIILYLVEGIVTYAFLQAKHYTNAIDYNAIATFTAAIALAGEQVQLETSLLCITGSATDLVQRMARLCNYKIITVSEGQLLAKEAELESLDATASTPPMEARDYQLSTVDMVMKAYEDCVETCIIGHPPGCGKTFIMSLCAIQFFGGLGISNIIVACPGRSSAQQAFDIFNEFLGENAEVILVSTDGSTSITFEEDNDTPQHRLYITTFRSFDVVIAAMTDDMDHDNTVFFIDEAHYPCVEDMVEPVIDKDILVVLVSGTSDYISPNLQCDGKYRCSMLLKDAEDRGLVVSQDHFFPSYLDDTPFADIDKPSSMPEAYAKFVAAVFARRGSTRSLVYWNDVEGAKIVVRAVEQELIKLSFPAKFELIVGDTPGSERQQRFDWIADGPDTEYRGIVSIQTLNDSLDLPRINGIAIPSIGNVATALQRVFRGNRTYPNKESCTVAFFTTPEEVVTMFPATYINSTQRVRCVSDNLLVDTMERDVIATTAARASVTKIVDDYVNNVSVINWGWKHWIQLLEEFIAGFGFKNLVKSTPYEGRALGQWYHKRLADFRNGQLSEIEIQAMRNAGVVFESVPAQRKAPVLFKDKLGIVKQALDAGVKVKQTTPFKGYPVGEWFMNWRTRKHRLTPDEIASLDAIGFAWNAQDAKFDAQIQAYRLAKDNGGVKTGTKEYKFRDNVRTALNETGEMKIDRRKYDLALEVGIIKEGEFQRPAT